MPKTKEPRDLRHMCVSYVEAAAFLQIPERRFRDLVDKGVIPKAARGEYELGAVCEAYEGHMADAETLKAAKARLTTAQAELTELELAQEHGELHKAEAVKAVWTDNVVNAKARLLAIPNKIAPELLGQDLLTIQKKLKDAIYEALQELSEYSAKQIQAITER